jgi:hypothetical protein
MYRDNHVISHTDGAFGVGSNHGGQVPLGFSTSADGFAMGRREDLTGGGLRRSAGGWEALKELQLANVYWHGDERILGEGDFVDEVLRAAEERLARREVLKRQGWDLQRLVREICEMLSVEPEDLQRKGRNNNLSHAKGLICYLGQSLSVPAICLAVRRGEEIARTANCKLPEAMNELKILRASLYAYAVSLRTGRRVVFGTLVLAFSGAAPENWASSGNKSASARAACVFGNLVLALLVRFDVI